MASSPSSDSRTSVAGGRWTLARVLADAEDIAKRGELGGGARYRSAETQVKGAGGNGDVMYRRDEQSINQAKAIDYLYELSSSEHPYIETGLSRTDEDYEEGEPEREQRKVHFATILTEDNRPYCAIEPNTGYFGVDFFEG